MTEELAECVTAVPVEPYPWQALSRATGLLAGEYAVYRRRGKQVRPKPFEEFVAEAEDILELRAEGEPEGESDEGYAFEMLQVAAGSGLCEGLEDCYRLACKTAILNLGLWWSEIAAVAEQLREIGELSGEEVVAIIEAASQGNGSF